MSLIDSMGSSLFKFDRNLSSLTYILYLFITIYLKFIASKWNEKILSCILTVHFAALDCFCPPFLKGCPAMITLPRLVTSEWRASRSVTLCRDDLHDLHAVSRTHYDTLVHQGFCYGFIDSSSYSSGRSTCRSAWDFIPIFFIFIQFWQKLCQLLG